MICWHDWAIFNAPTSSILIRKEGTKYLYRFLYIAKGDDQPISLGVGYYADKFSDLVCYKCNKKKLNLTNILYKRQHKSKKATELKRRDRDIANTKAKKVSDIKKKKEQAIIAARKDMARYEDTNGKWLEIHNEKS